MQTQLNKHTGIPINVDTCLRKSHASQKLSDRFTILTGYLFFARKYFCHSLILKTDPWQKLTQNTSTTLPFCNDDLQLLRENSANA